MRNRFVLVAMAVGAAGLLGGCAESSRLPVACQRPGLLAEGADLTRYRPGPVRDLTTLEWDARLTGLNGGCNPGRENRSLDVTLTARFSVERGPSAEGRVVELPWFVAVVDAQSEAVLSRQSFVEQVVFARNESRTAGESGPVTVSLPVGKDRRPQDYRILVSFQLAPEDLALNRRRGPR